MTTIRVIGASGAARDIEPAGQAHLMELLKDHGLVAGSCGGNISCASCHVHLLTPLAEGAAEPSPEERDLLEFTDGATERSRLACQVPLVALPEGCEIAIPA